MSAAPMAKRIMDGSLRPSADNPRGPEALSGLRAMLRSCPIIRIQNVSDYLASTQDERGFRHPPVFASLAPPFEIWWMESREDLIPGLVSESSSPTGVLVTAEEATDDTRLRYPSARWSLVMRMFYIGRSDDLHGPVLQLDVVLDGDGNEVDSIASTLDADYSLTPFPETEQFDAAHTMIRGQFMPVLFAISLMHCKNVTLREERVPAKLLKARRRRGRPDGLVRWSVLEIEPMKQVLRTEGQIGTLGLRQALHICRGHFKDYRQSGLFGKVKGIFWWDSTVRGSSKEGVVVKDYDVKPGARP